VAQKVQRRLQHFIDRKIATLFEPLLNLSRDEALDGLARGFAFRMAEGLGILPRGPIADEVKALDQDARGALRKHGIRFGQFTIFMPLLLKPAPTRLRLVLWSLANGLDVFPEAPPPGLVTVPAQADASEGYFTMAGYRAAGERAIRIDMLERLADMLRSEDSRNGFEAKADMLSITGMTLEQFAALMEGLGYRAEKGERAKVKAVDAVMAAQAEASGDAPAAADVPEGVEAIADEGVAPVAADVPEAGEVAAEIPEVAAGEVETGAAVDAGAAGAEMEVFYTFTWGRQRQARGNNERRGGGNRGPRQDGGKRAEGGAPRGKGGKPKGKGGPKGGKGQQGGARVHSARPPKADKPIDPDNPFAAALMGLRDKN
jgi:ATP-dependent RNA helicase SUPV3L1/SUV3